MASSLAAPRTSDNVPTGFGILNTGGTPSASWLLVLDAVVLTTEETPSGALAVGGKVLHDAADRPAVGPIKIGGYAKAAAPSVVSADADIVNAWFTLRGEQAVSLTQAGVFIGIADDAAFTPATSIVIPAGFHADESATDSVDEGDAGAARMTLDRKIIVTPQPHTAGGLSTFNASGADGADNAVLTSTAVAVKGSAGQLYGWFIYNPNDEASMVNFYDIAQGSTTVGSSNVKLQLTIPAGAAANLQMTHGIPFATAITVSATKTAGSSTAPDTGMDVQLFYK